MAAAAADAAGDGAARLLEFWERLDLTAWQRDLDSEAEGIRSRRGASDTSRKVLVEATREFRQQADEETRKKVAPLIKRFQSEVDALSKRSKAAETSFLNVYKQLATAPDPAPLIANALSSEGNSRAQQDLELENQRLRKKIEEYHAEFADIKNQEVTIKRLTDRIKEFEDEMDAAVEAKVREKEKSLVRQFAEKERDLQDKQVALATKLGQAEQEADVLRAALDSTQSELYDVRQKHDEEIAARGGAFDFLQADLDRSHQQVDALRKELEMERERLASLQTQSMDSSSLETRMDEMERLGLEKELAAKERETARLIDDHRDLLQQFQDFKHTAEDKYNAYEATLDDRETQIRELRKQVDSQADYDEIRAELATLKAIEFGESNSFHSGDKPLEVLLLEKNRQLESDNTSLKTQLAEQSVVLSQLQDFKTQAETTMETQKSLITQLESDLSAVNVVAPTSPNDSVVEIPSTEQLLTGGAPPPPSSASAAAEGQDSILPIVSAQRDRFKSRNLALETENRAHQNTISTLRNELDGLRADNVKLYEKLKFVQSYPSRPHHADDAVNRYSADYEEQLNPFSAFSAKEKQRKYTSLSAADKFSLSLGKLILSNRYARLVFVIYLAILHFLTFVVLYKLTHAEVSQQSMAEMCMSQFQHHMHDVHHQDIGNDALLAANALAGDTAVPPR